MDRTNEVGTIARTILAQRLLWCRERGAELRQETVDALTRDAIDSAREANAWVHQWLRDDDAQKQKTSPEDLTRTERIVRLALDAKALGMFPKVDEMRDELTTFYSSVRLTEEESAAVRKALAAKDSAP